jgi:hypothetical protein
MMLGYVYDTTPIWRLWDFETNTGLLHGRPFHWSDVEWEEHVNAFRLVASEAAGSCTAGDSEPEELVFPDKYYEDPPPSQPASLNLPGAEAPCHRDTVSPHVEMPPVPAPCHRDTVSPHVEISSTPPPSPCHRDTPSPHVEIPSMPPPSPCYRDTASPHVESPPLPAPCHRDTASPHVEMPSMPSPCHRDTASPHVDQCIAYALIISCNLQLLLTFLIVCRVAKL